MFHTTAAAVFSNVFAAATDIAFNEAWANETGYFNHAAKPAMNAIIPEGQVFKTIDQFNRRLVLVGTTFGPVVVFDRFRDAKDGIIVFNCPQELKQCQLVNGNGNLSRAELVEIFGDPDLCDSKNVGQRVASLRHLLEQAYSLSLSAALTS